MVLDKLGDSLKSTLTKITKSVFVDDKLIAELVKDIQRSLLQSDVNVKLVFALTKEIKERATNEKTPATITKKEHLIRIVYEEMVKFLGGEQPKFEITKKPYVMMLVGLFGSGKTTTTGKLGKYFQKRGHKIALVQTDTWRPAAYTQLQQLGEQINADVFGSQESKDPVEIWNNFAPKKNNYDIVIVDTAGRDALSDELIEELNSINSIVQPDERLLVISADIGQTAEQQARKFHETVNVSGVIITKLDGTAKGGGALIACSVTEANVKFIGTGEKIDDMEMFNPPGFVGRLLGMGDLEALLEKTQEVVSQDKAEDMGKKLLKGDFNLLDLHEQISMMKKMGPLSKVMDMIPGMGQANMPKDMLSVQDDKLNKWKFMMNSMTKEELENPEIMSGGRVERVASGSGTSNSDVRDLIKHYKQSKKMMKMFKGKEGNVKKMMEKMQSGKMPNKR